MLFSPSFWAESSRSCYPVGVVWASCSFEYLISKMLTATEGSSYCIPSTAMCSAGWSLLSCSDYSQSWSSPLQTMSGAAGHGGLAEWNAFNSSWLTDAGIIKQITEMTGGWALKTRINWTVLGQKAHMEHGVYPAEEHSLMGFPSQKKEHQAWVQWVLAQCRRAQSLGKFAGWSTTSSSSSTKIHSGEILWLLTSGIMPHSPSKQNLVTSSCQ